MRPVRDITSEEENFRMEPIGTGFLAPRRDAIEPEPIGTIIVRAFRITGYDRDCDGSLMARLEAVDEDGRETGWCPDRISLRPDSSLVITPEELKSIFQSRNGDHQP